MTRVRKIGVAGCRVQAWRNGRGRTLEIAREPDGGDASSVDYAWRLARAGVTEDGPFSDFPGYERLLVVIAGAGLELEFAATHEHEQRRAMSPRRERVRRLEPFRFAGAPAPRARLVAGPIEDLGLIYDGRLWRAECAAPRLGARALRLSPEAAHVLVHALAGTLEARVSGEEQPIELTPGETLHVAALRRGDEIELCGTSSACELAWIALTRA